MADFETVVAKDTTVRDGSCRHYALNFLGKAEEAVEEMRDLQQAKKELLNFVNQVNQELNEF